jgi:hypothetical protein
MVLTLCVSGRCGRTWPPFPGRRRTRTTWTPGWTPSWWSMSGPSARGSPATSSSPLSRDKENARKRRYFKKLCILKFATKLIQRQILRAVFRIQIRSQIPRIHMFLGLLHPDPDLPSSSKNSKKILDSYCFVISFWHFFL